MRRLENTKEDKDYLSKLLEKGEVSAIIHIGVFPTKYVIDFKCIPYKGIITSIDTKSGYCNWKTEDIEQPIVNINCISIL